MSPRTMRRILLPALALALGCGSKGASRAAGDATGTAPSSSWLAAEDATSSSPAPSGGAAPSSAGGLALEPAAPTGIPELTGLAAAGDEPVFSWNPVPGAALYSIVVGRPGSLPWIWEGTDTRVAYGTIEPIPDLQSGTPAHRIPEALEPGPGWKVSVTAYDAEQRMLAVSRTATIPPEVGRRAAAAAPVALISTRDPTDDEYPPVSDELAATLLAERAAAANPSGGGAPAIPGMPSIPGLPGGINVGALMGQVSLSAPGLPDWHLFAAQLPDVLAGAAAAGAADGTTATAMGMSLSTAQRRYSLGGRTVAVTVSAGDVADMGRMAFSRMIPDSEAADDIRRHLQVGRHQAVLEWKRGRGESNVKIQAGEKVLVEIVVSGSTTPDEALAFARALNLDAIAALH